MAADFLKQLNALVDQSGLKHKEIAAKVLLDQSYLTKILKGQKPLPGDRIEAFADALGLTGQARKRFLDEAHLAVAPDFLRQRLSDLQKYEQAEPWRSSHRTTGEDRPQPG